jgi:hypothetical protein
VFKQNFTHLQIPFTSNVDELPDVLRKRLQNSWAGSYYRDVFCHIDETVFAVLYVNFPSRPNNPINIMVGLEWLKAGNGWTDEELYDFYCYDIQVRYALGLHQLSEGYFDLRSLYHFRQRLSEHMQKTGENLIEKAFEQITDKQLAAYELKTGKQRMDSFQIASNIRQFGRVQLLVTVLQRTQRMLNEADQVRYADDFAPYLKGHAGHYVYRLKKDEVGARLQIIGDLMARLLTDLEAGYGKEDGYQVLARTFGDHFHYRNAKVAIKANEELSADSLQSPDDTDATYRTKRGQGYQGYVTNVTETCDPGNKLQLITKVQVASNNTDDSQLLAEAVPNLAARTNLETMYTDGGHGGPDSDKELAEHKIDHIQSAIRGCEPDPAKLHLADFDIRFSEDGAPSQATCPGGQTVPVNPSSQQKSFVACFDAEKCAACHFAPKNVPADVTPDNPEPPSPVCPAQAGKRDPRPRVRFPLADARAAQRRRKSRERQQESGNLRSAVEATVRCVKLPYPDAQVPVRGKFRVTCLMIGSAAMSNVRRIRRYLLEAKSGGKKGKNAQNGQETAQGASADSFFGILRAFGWRFFLPRPVSSLLLGC